MDWNKFRENRKKANLEILDLLRNVIENEKTDFRFGQLMYLMQLGYNNDFFSEEPHETLKRYKENEIVKLFNS